MTLAGALGLDSRELVSFVGAGGKKTAMAHLVAKARSRSLTAGYTTTAHMPPPSFPLFVGDIEDLMERVERSREDALSFAREWVADPERVDEKVAGFDPSTVDDVFRLEQFDWLLVKADGARLRELKAPDEDEPPIPTESTRIVPVASVRAVGAPLSSELVHRIERVASLTGLDPGDFITPEAVGTLLAHPEGGCKNVPREASVIPLINKADTPEQREAGRRAIETALGQNERIERGLVASLKQGTIEIVDR